MVENGAPHITEDEAALYDRQIRLWGLDAQKRLRASSVLLCGVCGLGAEVAKNLILAGIKSLTLLDHSPVTALDTVSNFLAPSDSVGQNIAEASKERAQALNPMVSVRVDTDVLASKEDSFFTGFDVVVVARCGDKELLTRINEACRSSNTLFYAGGVHGMFGYMFADLAEHSFVEETKESTEVMVNGEKVKQEETKLTKRTERFAPLCAALDIDWTSETYARRLKRTNPGYFLMQVVLEFEALHGRRPSPSQRGADATELHTIKHSLLERWGVPQEKLPSDFAGLLFGQVSPVCAIVGGEVAAEVIKAVSQKDAPHNNCFFFSPLDDGSGTVHAFGY